jgi:hypothetical protein
MAILAAALLSGAAGCTTVDPAPAGDYAVVVNEERPEEDISFDRLRKTFRAERAFWEDGDRVTLAMPLQGSPERLFLLGNLLNTTERSLKRHWREMRYQDKVTGPPDRMPRAEALQTVAGDKGAVTLVKADQLPEDAPGVKVLAVDGKKPGDAGYPLHADGN